MITLREDFSRFEVVVYDDNVVVGRFPEYMLAERWAANMYSLSEEQLVSIRVDYKEDYERQLNV